NSLQYLQARLQRRTGMMCARSGCSVERRAWATARIPRILRYAFLNRRRRVVVRDGIARLFIRSQRADQGWSYAVFGLILRANGRERRLWKNPFRVFGRARITIRTFQTSKE